MNTFANVLLHIVLYAIIILAFMGGFSILDKRKLQAQLWLTINDSDSLGERIRRDAQNLGYSTGDAAFESKRTLLITEWLNHKKKAERTIHRINLDTLLGGSVFGMVLGGVLLIIGAPVLMILFLDSLDLDFTRLFIALEVLRGHG